MKTAVVIGSTGLVGSHLVEQLCLSPAYSKIILLNRRASLYKHVKIEEKIIDFDQPDLTGFVAQDVFCAIGSTIKKAGSQEAQFKIDCKYPTQLATMLKENGAQQFMLVSSIGASSNSSSFYLRTKGQLENNLLALHYPTLIVLRPSLILGTRKEFRLGEKVGVIFMKVLGPLFFGKLKKYKGVQASAIASKMIEMSNQQIKGCLIIESDKI